MNKSVMLPGLCTGVAPHEGEEYFDMAGAKYIITSGEGVINSDYYTNHFVSYISGQISKGLSFNNHSVLDVGCGRGTISVGIKKRFRDASVIGIDLDSRSVELSNYNARINSVNGISYLCRDIFYDNGLYMKKYSPNYIVSTLPTLPYFGASCNKFRHLLDGGTDGMKNIRKLIELASGMESIKSIYVMLNDLLNIDEYMRFCERLGFTPEAVSYSRVLVSNTIYTKRLIEEGIIEGCSKDKESFNTVVMRCSRDE